MVASLIDDQPERFAAVEYHTQFDGYDTPWGQDRLDRFYGGWCGGLIPIMMYDGVWFWEPEDYGRGLYERLAETTDVTIELTAREERTQVWAVTADVCIEPGGTGRRMRIYAVQTLDRWPSQPSYSRRTFKQAAPTQDVELAPGGCVEVSATFTFDPESWSRPDDIAIVVWAQDPADYGPAEVHQAAQILWPFPEDGGPIEPEMPRGFELALPLFDSAASAWHQDARSAAVIDGSMNQLEATYRALCGDTSGLFPVDDPPTSDQPWPRVAVDHGSLPVFEAGSGTQEVLLCDYDGNVRDPNAKWNVPTEGGPVEVPACDGDVRPSGPPGLDASGYLVLVGAGGSTTFDFWQATTQRQAECLSDGGGLPGPAILQAGQADFFALDGSGANDSGVRSARPSGTALLAGAVLPEDVASGQIEHALAVAVPGLRNLAPDPSSPLASDVFYPASSTDGERYSIQPDALAAGQRLRLRGSLLDASGSVIDETELAPITTMFLRAARRYGAYVVDTADGFVFFAEDLHTAVLDLDDAAINSLIGEPAGSALPSDRTRWQIVMEKLNDELAGIPFAQGPCDGVSSEVENANWVVVEPADAPSAIMPAPRHVSGRLRPQTP